MDNDKNARIPLGFYKIPPNLSKKKIKALSEKIYEDMIGKIKKIEKLRESEEDILDKIPKQEVFVSYDFENVKVRTTPKDEYFIRRGNKEETPVVHDSKLFKDALLAGKEITKEEYYA